MKLEVPALDLASGRYWKSCWSSRSKSTLRVSHRVVGPAYVRQHNTNIDWIINGVELHTEY